MTKDELEAAITVANEWSGRSTLVLALGILGEYALLPFLEGRKRWEKSAKFIFAVMVVVGIIGEYRFSSEIGQSAAELQRLSDTEVALTRADAESAKTLAKQYEAQIADSNVRIKEAEARASEAKSMAEAERLERIKIEERIAGWRLSTDSENRLAAELRIFAGTPFDLLADPSEMRFLASIDRILAAAGWVKEKATQPNGKEHSILLGGTTAIVYGVPGINIEVAQESLPRFNAAFSALIEGLKAEGIPAKGNVAFSESRPGLIHVFVGRRP